MAMLYRHETESAVGHGIAVQADLAAAILPMPEDTPALAGLMLDMAAPSAVPDGAFAVHLALLVTAYDAWIEGLAERVATPDERLRPYAEDAAPTP